MSIGPMKPLRSLPERAVTKRELAEILGVSESTLNRIRRDARQKGSPMPEVTYGRRIVRFYPGRVQRWLDEQERAA